MQQTSKNNLVLWSLIGVAVIITGILIYMQKNKTGSGDTISPTSTKPIGKAVLTHYSNAAHYFEFDYPNLLTVSTSTASNSLVELISPYYAVADFGGTGDLTGSSVLPQGMKYYFSITLEPRNGALEDAMRKDNPNFVSTYTDLKENRKVDADFLQSETLAERPAFIFNLGAEGFNSKFIYIAKDANETLVVHIQHIGSSLKDQMKPGALSEQEQAAAYNTVLLSLKIKS